jgi:hypothetical protein
MKAPAGGPSFMADGWPTIYGGFLHLFKSTLPHQA